MEPGTDDTSPTPQAVETVIDEFLQAGRKSGNYQSNLRSVLEKFREWLSGRGVTEISAVDSG